MSSIHLSVIIPAYNEEKRISFTLKVIENYLNKQDYSFEVIVVDDGSTDKTREVVTGSTLKPKITPKRNNRGKGYSIQEGVLMAQGEYILFADADNATPFEQIDKLWPYREEFDIIIGSRYILKPKIGELNYFKSLFHSTKELLSFLFLGKVPETTIKKKQSWFRQLMSRGGNYIFVLFLGLGYEDTRCGFKLFRGSTAKKLFSLSKLERWGFDTEILYLAKKFRCKVIEVPVEWFDTAGGEITKNPIKAAIGSFKEIFQIKWYNISGIYKR